MPAGFGKPHQQHGYVQRDPGEPGAIADIRLHWCSPLQVRRWYTERCLTWEDAYATLTGALLATVRPGAPPVSDHAKHSMGMRSGTPAIRQNRASEAAPIIHICAYTSRGRHTSPAAQIGYARGCRGR